MEKVYKTKTFWTGILMIIFSLWFGYLSLESKDQTQFMLSAVNLVTGAGMVFGRNAITKTANQLTEIQTILTNAKDGKQPTQEEIDKLTTIITDVVNDKSGS